jgi:hypothetical protein
MANEIGRYVSLVGEKLSQTDGMMFGHNALYFGAMQLNSIYKWDFIKDMVRLTKNGMSSIGGFGRFFETALTAW